MPLRSSCTLARASGPVTHFDAPVRVAMRPSSETASLSETYGSPVVTHLAQGAMSARASFSLGPTTTSMPAARRRSTPPPSRAGWDRCSPPRPCAILASRMASTQGGRAAVVVARLERHVERGPFGFRAGDLERLHLGVILARFFVMPDGEHLSALDDRRRRREDSATDIPCSRRRWLSPSIRCLGLPGRRLFWGS